MSGPSTPSHLLQHEENHESDVVQQDPNSQMLINQEPPFQNQPDPDLDPDNPEEGEQLEGEAEAEAEAESEEKVVEAQDITEEISSGMPPPITDVHVSFPDVTLPQNPNPRRGANKRKKGKGKGKFKLNVKKQQIIDKKVRFLTENLNPIPFVPHKILDFSKHEELLRKLGLWDLVNIDFDHYIRVDLLAQLVASYENRCGYVNGFRIRVSRADLARAFKVPLTRKDKNNMVSVPVDLDSSEVLSSDSIAFMVEFVLDWVLLHEDAWIMPKEVMDWINVIKNGQPEKVDWAGLIWLMVEKELNRGEKLEDCYYASHLQHLMKEQKVFLREEAIVELNVKIEDGEDVHDGIEVKEEENSVMGGPNIELTLGQDGEKEEGSKSADEDGGVDEQGRWPLDWKNDDGEHFMQRCSAGNIKEFDVLEETKMEEENEEEEGEKYHVFPNHDGLEENGLTGNFLDAMEANQSAFDSEGQFCDMQQMGSIPAYFNQAGKRVLEHDDSVILQNDGNKRLRIGDSSDHRPVDLLTCFDQIQQLTERARISYEEKKEALNQANMHQQILLDELQKRDNVIEYLQKTSLETTKEKDGEIYRLERELYVMGNVVDGYRKALKETQKAFDEYRDRVQLPEEPTYRDFGNAGLMLSSSEIEKIRKQQEAEFHMKCMLVEQHMKEAEEEYAAQFDGFLEKIDMLNQRLNDLEGNAKEFIELCAEKKVVQIEEKVNEAEENFIGSDIIMGEPSTTSIVSKIEERVPEAGEPLAEQEPLVCSDQIMDEPSTC